MKNRQIVEKRAGAGCEDEGRAAARAQVAPPDGEEVNAFTDEAAYPGVAPGKARGGKKAVCFRKRLSGIHSL